jgi:hypothetical protein
MSNKTRGAMAVAVAALISTTTAVALSDERMQCAPPIVRDMTVYRPACAPDGPGSALLRPPVCSPQWWAFEAPCLSHERVD